MRGQPLGFGVTGTHAECQPQAHGGPQSPGRRWRARILQHILCPLATLWGDHLPQTHPGGLRPDVVRSGSIDKAAMRLARPNTAAPRHPTSLAQRHGRDCGPRSVALRPGSAVPGRGLLRPRTNQACWCPVKTSYSPAVWLRRVWHERAQAGSPLQETQAGQRCRPQAGLRSLSLASCQDPTLGRHL